MSSDKIVCSTDDVTVRQSDLRSLLAGQFLSDVALSFATSELERSLPAAVRRRVALLQATTAFLGTTMNVEPALVAALQLEQKDVVFLPINDNAEPGVAFGGSHWSLLVYVRRANQFWHYDSMHERNLPVARLVARNFAQALAAAPTTS